MTVSTLATLISIFLKPQIASAEAPVSWAESKVALIIAMSPESNGTPSLVSTLASSETGAIAVTDIYGNNPDPFSAEHLTVRLLRPGDRRVFARLMDGHATLARVVINDPRDGMRFVLRDVTISAMRAEPCAGSCHGNGLVFVTLQSKHKVSLRCGPPACLKPQ
jgi:hypothetical protein